MTTKRKISVRKVLRALVTLVVTTGCIVAVLGASQIQQTKSLRHVTMHVRNDAYQFLDKQALWNEAVANKGITEGKTRLSKLDIKKVERAVLSNQWVSEAQVYVDNNRDMQIYVTQRVPVARIFFESGQSFYLDGSLRLLPLSELFTYYTTIVTNVPVLKNDSLNRNLRAEIVKLVRFVERDTFWSAQIAQISVTPDLKFELTPVLGTHRILFGDTANMQRKFENLFAFYKKVLNRIGWDRYDILDLRYQDQVVASPSIPWKPPTKNAISNMDWVKSIMGDAPKDSTKPFVVQNIGQKPPVTSPGVIQKPLVTAQSSPAKKPGVKVEQNKQDQTNKEKKESGKPQNAKYIYQGNANH